LNGLPVQQSLKRETARNGQPIFKLEGRSIVSSFDPSREAHVWAEKALVDLGDRDSLIVLGAACGYHIVALRHLRPSLSILTIEASEEIAEFAREVFSSQPEADAAHYGSILVASKPIELSESLILRDFMARRFAVVAHPGLAQIRPDWSREIGQFLTGRDFLSFLLQLRMRPELHALFDEEKIAKLSTNGSPLSILTIRNLFSAQAQTARERRIWRVLEELIV
jgi:hypothetical protein